MSIDIINGDSGYADALSHSTKYEDIVDFSNVTSVALESLHSYINCPSENPLSQEIQATVFVESDDLFSQEIQKIARVAESRLQRNGLLDLAPESDHVRLCKQEVEALDLSVYNPHEKRKADQFCIEELAKSITPRIKKLTQVGNFIHYVYFQEPKKLPYRTQQVSLELLAGGDEPFKKITVEKRLGQGSYGLVNKIRTSDQEAYAQKVLTEANPINYALEYGCLIHLDHPNIVKILHADQKYLYMEVIEGTTLEKCKMMEDCSRPKEGVNIFIQVADALSYAHDMGYSHNDLEPWNIMITTDNTTAKLIDFGKSAIFSPDTDVVSFAKMLGDFVYTAEFDSTEPQEEAKKILKELVKQCEGETKPTMHEIREKLSVALAKFGT